ncbi:MAG: DNA-processing protein DprA [Candidatus Muiribacteriota bacterium]
MNNLKDLICFSYFTGDFLKKLAYFKNNRTSLLKKTSLNFCFGSNQTAGLFNTIEENEKQIENIISEVKTGSLKVLTVEDKLYPEELKNICDAPVILYCRGNPELLSKRMKIAVVGARKTDLYGKKASLELSQNLAGNDFCVVSGLAYGIDGFAHEGALKEENGSTIAVLAADGIFPKRNKKLYDNIEKKGLIISEFPTDYYVGGSMFLARNRIIAGLSKGVIIVRATLKSGSLSTANFALDYNRDVFALPGNVYENLSKGSNHLIRQGAIPVSSFEEVAEYYGAYEENKYLNQKQQKLELEEEKKPVLLKDEEEIIQNIGYEPVLFDELCEITRFKVSKTARILTKLELKGYIKKISGSKYIRL